MIRLEKEGYMSVGGQEMLRKTSIGPAGAGNGMVRFVATEGASMDAGISMFLSVETAVPSSSNVESNTDFLTIWGQKNFAQKGLPSENFVFSREWLKRVCELLAQRTQEEGADGLLPASGKGLLLLKCEELPL